MSNRCPDFETLSRFHDGMIEGAEEADLLAHVASCAVCEASLDSMEAADGLLTAAVAPRRQARRLRLPRPALLPLAAALLFALTLSYFLTSPPAAQDSPIAVAELTPSSAAPAAEPVANVFLRERFEGAELHPGWKGVDGSPALVEAEGRRAVQLLAHPGGKKRWGLLSSASEYPVGQGVSFDVDYRIPKAQKGGRMQVLLQTKMPKLGRGVLRWSRTSDEELLEAQIDGRSKPVVLWSAKAEPPDPRWHALKLTVTRGEVRVHRDGIEVARESHGLSFERVALTLASTIDKRGKESREPFECQVGRVLVVREEAK